MKSLIAIFTIVLLWAVRGEDQSPMPPNHALFPATSKGVGGQLPSQQAGLDRISVFIRGKDKAFSSEEIASRAKKAALLRSPSFSFADAEVVVSVDSTQTNRLAAVTFSHGIGKPVLKVTLGPDGVVTKCEEMVAEELIINNTK